MTFKRTLGALLDAVTLSTVAILATIALVGAADPAGADDAVPLMVGVFAITLFSGTAKIVLNRIITRKPNDPRGKK